MRNGDFSIEIVPTGPGRVRETGSGHVLARPGQVYRLRLRNHGPLRCVVDADIDGHRVTAGGLVLNPWATTDLERPVDASEHGCFTVVAEGDEGALGPDGGRDDPDLGLIVARFRRELPRPDLPPEPPRIILSRFGRTSHDPRANALMRSLGVEPPHETSLGIDDDTAVSDAVPRSLPEGAIERAAGTGLTGHSDQRFVPIHVGELEAEATVLQLRLVIGSEAAIAAEPARPLGDRQAPARPAARP